MAIQTDVSFPNGLDLDDVYVRVSGISLAKEHWRERALDEDGNPETEPVLDAEGEPLTTPDGEPLVRATGRMVECSALRMRYIVEAFASQAARQANKPAIGSLGSFHIDYAGGDVFEEAYAALKENYPDAVDC